MQQLPSQFAGLWRCATWHVRAEAADQHRIPVRKRRVEIRHLIGLLPQPLRLQHLHTMCFDMDSITSDLMSGCAGSRYTIWLACCRSHSTVSTYRRVAKMIVLLLQILGTSKTCNCIVRRHCVV